MFDRKLPGKQEWSGRRRTTTRVSGYHSHKDATGGHYAVEGINECYRLEKGEKMSLIFDVNEASGWSGFGGYFWYQGEISVSLSGLQKKTLKIAPSGLWSKFGSMWEGGKDTSIKVVFEAIEDSNICFYDHASGEIGHRHLDSARSNLLGNMHQFSPEAHFFTSDSNAPVIEGGQLHRVDGKIPIILKQCNRCARYLPINYDSYNPDAERHHLAFTNHCIAKHRIPCTHGGFGLLKSRQGEDDIDLTYGFQLECRFCKKFEVNAAHNPQRTSAQMKEDGARRRHIELLLEHIYQGTPQLVYRSQYGSELTDDIWHKFDRKCFNCHKAIDNPRDMHLDHTRPLMMLWPLDATATCLCGDCNIAKSGNPPSIFYSARQLKQLSSITGLSMVEMADEGPNEEVIDIIENDLDWLFEELLTTPQMQRIHDGKVAGEQLIKALVKPFSSSKKTRIDIISEYNIRRKLF